MKEIFENAEKKGLKVTFGLQREDISLIEDKFKDYPDFKYNTTIWNDIGKEIGWHPLTAALYYFRFLENKDIE